MRGTLRVVFGAHAQVAIGVFAFVVGVLLWIDGCFIIHGAVAWPWRWSPIVFVFHASMFFGLVACYAIVSTGLGYRAVERVPAQVVDSIIQADELTVNVEAVDASRDDRQDAETDATSDDGVARDLPDREAPACDGRGWGQLLAARLRLRQR